MGILITFDHLFLSSKEYIKSLQKELNLIISNPQYLDSAQILAKTFRQLSEKADIEIDTNQRKYYQAEKHLGLLLKKKRLNKQEKIEKQYVFPQEMHEARIQVERIFIYFKYVTGLIRYIVTSSLDTIPQGLLYPFQNIIEAFSPKAYIFIRQQWTHNYKYGEFIDQLLDDKYHPKYFEYIKTEFKFKLCMIAYPSLEIDNYLYNCNIAHEIGHYLDNLHPLFTKEEFKTSSNITDNLSKILDPRIALKDIADKLQEVLNISYRWYEELIADVYATLMLGIAYLFSFLEFYETSEFEFDQTHPNQKIGYPSPRMRLYFIIKTLKSPKIGLIKFFNDNKDKAEWFKVVDDKLTSLQNEVKDEIIEGKVKENSFANVAWLSNKELLEKIINEILNGPLKIHIDQTIKNSVNCFKIKLVNDVEKKLNNKIPINEILKGNKKSIFYETSPMSIYQILNFGWLRFFELLNLYTSASETEKDKDRYKDDIFTLKQLIRRSVEASYLHQKFLENKDRLEI